MECFIVNFFKKLGTIRDQTMKIILRLTKMWLLTRHRPWKFCSAFHTTSKMPSVWNDCWWHFVKLNVSLPCCPLHQNRKPQKEASSHTLTSQLTKRSSIMRGARDMHSTWNLFTIMQNPSEYKCPICVLWRRTICHMMTHRNEMNMCANVLDWIHCGWNTSGKTLAYTEVQNA